MRTALTALELAIGAALLIGVGAYAASGVGAMFGLVL